MLQDTTIVVTTPPELVNVLVSGMAILGTAAASILLGAYKKYVNPLEGAIGKVIKPFQPIIITVLGATLPILFQTIGAPIQEDAAQIIAGAPIAGIIVITARELLRRFTKAA